MSSLPPNPKSALKLRTSPEFDHFNSIHHGLLFPKPICAAEHNPLQKQETRTLRSLSPICKECSQNMVADKETPLEYTTIPSRQNKKTQTGNTRFTLSQLRALPLHAQPGNGDFWRQNNDKMRERTRKLTKNTECDGLRAHYSVGEAQTRVLAVGGGGGEQKAKMTKRTTFKGNLKNLIY